MKSSGLFGWKKESLSQNGFPYLLLARGSIELFPNKSNQITANGIDDAKFQHIHGCSFNEDSIHDGCAYKLNDLPDGVG